MVKKNTAKSKQEIAEITVKNKKNKENYIIVGVDLSKSKLDVKHIKYKVYSNDEKGQARFIKAIKELGDNVVVAYEATGYISLNFAEMLDTNGIKRCQVSPKRVRHHAKAGVAEAKTDKLDCEVIQSYTMKYWEYLQINDPMSRNYAELQELQRVRNLYTQFIRQAKQVLSTCRRESVRKPIEENLEKLKEEQKKIEQKIKNLIDEDENTKNMKELLMNQPGVGKETATTLVLNLPELGRVTRREIAALTGTAPFNYDSGNHTGKRFTRFGRKGIRSLLYMATRAALNSKNENDYHRRFNHLSKITNLKGGRTYMQVIMACMRMMVVRLNGITRDWIAKGKPDYKTYTKMKEEEKKKQEEEQKQKEQAKQEKNNQEQ